MFHFSQVGCSKMLRTDINRRSFPKFLKIDAHLNLCESQKKGKDLTWTSWSLFYCLQWITIFHFIYICSTSSKYRFES
ncbi:hypothetical protein HanRHA438_Chr15g0709581 [Helianthus annuus]|nr:hypothetical protein HanRHA438_Chr15g0709581 [Helianthus annuus]